MEILLIAVHQVIQSLPADGHVGPSGEEAPKPVEATVTVAKKEIYTIGGESIVYLTDTDGVIYKKQLSSDEAMLFIAEGDELTISYLATGIEKLCEIVSWTKK